jgi:hypothetical protein
MHCRDAFTRQTSATNDPYMQETIAGPYSTVCQTVKTGQDSLAVLCHRITNDYPRAQTMAGAF